MRERDERVNFVSVLIACCLIAIAGSVMNWVGLFDSEVEPAEFRPQPVEVRGE